MRPRRLKLGTHVDCGQMYRVYWNQAAAAYLSLYFFIFLSNFQHYKFSSHFSQELWGLEGWNLMHTWTMFRCIVYTRIRLLLLIHPIYSFFFIFNFQTLKFFVTLFSGTVRPRRLKLGTHVDCGQMYRVYRNQAAAAYLSLFQFSLHWITLIFCIHDTGILKICMKKLDGEKYFLTKWQCFELRHFLKTAFYK